MGIVFLAVVFFFLFFGLLCSRGEEAFCDKFTSEIMITGYLILGFLLLIGGTSYVRHKIPYEVFYVVRPKQTEKQTKTCLVKRAVKTLRPFGAFQWTYRFFFSRFCGIFVVVIDSSCRISLVLGHDSTHLGQGRA